MKRVLAGLTALVLLVGVPAGCGSSSPSAAQQVCDAASTLRDSVKAVTTDVSKGNFGEARDGLTQVKAAYSQLDAKVANLKGEAKQTVGPKVDALKQDVANLQNVSSLEELQSSFTTISSDLQELYSQVTTDLKCS